MKILGILTLLFAGFVVAPVTAAGPDVSASELARHLGVNAWHVAAKNLPPKFTASIDIVSDGKIVEQYLTAVELEHNGDLVILSHSTKQGVEVSLGNESVFTKVPDSSLRAISISFVLNLPKDAGLGTYVLCGDNPKKNGAIKATDKVEELKSALVLRLR